MGCDIHSYAEVKRDGKWQVAGEVFELDDFDKERENKTHSLHPFDWRSYGLFGFLADVRNYSFAPTISKPRGMPNDLSGEVAAACGRYGDEGHSASWLSVKELLDYDYDAVFEDRRCSKQIGHNLWSGAADAGKGNGEQTTMREFLGPRFFADLGVLERLGPPEDTRVVFWFDN